MKFDQNFRADIETVAMYAILGNPFQKNKAILLLQEPYPMPGIGGRGF